MKSDEKNACSRPENIVRGIMRIWRGSFMWRKVAAHSWRPEAAPLDSLFPELA